MVHPLSPWALCRAKKSLQSVSPADPSSPPFDFIRPLGVDKEISHLSDEKRRWNHTGGSQEIPKRLFYPEGKEETNIYVTWRTCVNTQKLKTRKMNPHSNDHDGVLFILVSFLLGIKTTVTSFHHAETKPSLKDLPPSNTITLCWWSISKTCEIRVISRKSSSQNGTEWWWFI